MVPDIAKKGHSFDGAFNYYLHDKSAEGEPHLSTSERVAWTETRNLMTDDPQAAKRIMIATAKQSDELKAQVGIKTTGRKSNAHVYAYSLAWHPDEAGTVDRAGMMEAVDQSLKALEAEHLQAVVVCHTDQDHPHVHVILNRVDQSDGRMHPFKNDRLKLSDWANEYERERGQILTPAREEKRKKREQYQDQQKRRDYAQAKRDEAASRSRDKMHPASMLKDLGEAQKLRHRQEWKDLSATNKDRRQKVYAEYRERIKQAAELHRMENKKKWRDHFFDERKKRREFEARERSLFGVVVNAIHTTAIQHMRGELDGRGQLSATFSNVLSSGKRRMAFEGQIALTRDELRQMVKAPLDKQIERLKLERTAELKHVRSLFDRDRQALIQRQDEEWAKVREAWKQLKGRSYKPYQKRSADPVKKDWSASAPKEVAKPKPQPTRTATVSTAVPSPAPKGEVPRVNAKAQTVPRSKDWGKAKIEPSKKGIDGTSPAKKDWGKTNATKSTTVSKPKDWGKKADQSKTPKKAPRPSKDMGRTR